MLNLDNHYIMGKAHMYCEDYVLNDVNPLPFIVLCDGCSSSKNTDVGARILANMSRKVLAMYYQEHGEVPEYHSFGNMLIQTAEAVAEAMTVESGALNATVLLAWLERENTVRVYVYGDGCILLKTHDGRNGYVDIDFTTNMPYYLSYWLDDSHQEAYREATRGEDTLRVNNSLQGTHDIHAHNKMLDFSFSFDDYSMIGIASDGLNQFFDVEGSFKLPINDVIDNLMDFKNIHGEFVKRRLNKALQNYAQNGVAPLDDVAIGMMVNEELFD